VGKGHVTNERIEYTDSLTGARVIQLTSYPAPAMCLFYASVNITPDSARLILICQREARRDAPWDLWSVNADGSELRQMTDRDGAGGFAMLPDGSAVIFHCQGAVWKVDMADLTEERVAELSGGKPGGHGFVSPDGRYYFTATQTPGNGGRIAGAAAPTVYRARTDGSEVVAYKPDPSDQWTLHSASPGGHGLLAIAVTEGVKEYRLLDHDFRVLGVYTRTHDFAHSTFLGRSPDLQGCALPPDHALLRLGLGGDAPNRIASGPYFWHSASTLDGEWIVADTNWPDLGLQLVHVPTSRFATLCYPRSSEGHPQWSHPHPQFSPDGLCVMFNSDATGVPQAYVVQVSDEMKARVKSGALTVRDRPR
jgi:Tol biopolymer transport system component